MNLFEWHQWFAWRPVLVPGPRSGTKGLIWLETIYRRQVITGRKVGWQYEIEW